MADVRLAVIGLAGWQLLVGAATLGAVTVNDPGDALNATGCAATGTGTCTLRDAITFVNVAGGGEITFASGNMVIMPTAPMPAITVPVTINGGLSILGSSLPVIDGSLAGASDGLIIAGGGSTIYSIYIGRFQGTGLVLASDYNTIGGAVDCGGLRCFDHPTSSSLNGGNGMEITGSGNLVRYTGLGGNGGHGVFLHGGASGNTIGSDDTAAALYSYPGNFINGNALSGVGVGEGRADVLTRGNRVLGNTIEGNGGIGIDLGGDGVTANDLYDEDDGPNGLQNYPRVCSASIQPNGDALVSGSVAGAPDAELTLRFFVEPGTANPSGGTFLGKATVGMAGAERVFFSLSFAPSFNFPWPNPLGQVSATATDQSGNTSELSAAWSDATSGLVFHTLEPCRLVDSREPEAPRGGPALAQPRSFVLRGACGIPATARALAANVTVTNAAGNGHVSFATFASSGCPPETSVLNFSSGQTRASSCVLMLDGTGTLTAWPVVAGSGTVDLILDVTGYWE